MSMERSRSEREARRWSLESGGSVVVRVWEDDGGAGGILKVGEDGESVDMGRMQEVRKAGTDLVL